MTTVIAESLTADSLNLETLLELSRRSDPVGVLSVYLDARPGEGAQAATIDLKNRLAELERRLESEGPPEQARAVHDAAARLADEIDRLIDPEQPGRGRVVFAAIEDTWVTRVSTQMPLPNRVVFDRSPSSTPCSNSSTRVARPAWCWHRAPRHGCSNGASASSAPCGNSEPN